MNSTLSILMCALCVCVVGCKDVPLTDGAPPATTCEIPPAPVECHEAVDCPGIDSECQHRVCYKGSCTISLEPVGTRTTDYVHGDCRVAVCDGNGSTDLIFVEDPTDDRNDCTIDSCYDGDHVHEPVQAGAQCVLRSGGLMAIGSCSVDGECQPSAE